MTTITIDEHREKMLAYLSKDRYYEFLMMATPYLRLRDSDEFVRLMVVRAYVALGLVRPAIEVLHTAPPGVTGTDEIGTLRNALDCVAQPLQDWNSLSDRFATNLDALAQRGFDSSPLQQAWHQARANYELYIDTNRQYQVRRRDELGRWSWFPSLRNHAVADQREPLPESLKERFPMPIAFNSVGLGGLFERAYHETLNSFLGYSCALYVIEPNLADFAVALHLRNWSTILGDARVLLLVGSNWRQVLEQLTEEQDDIPLPVHALSIGPQGEARNVSEVRSAIEASHDVRDAAIRKNRSNVETRYAGHTVADMARRFSEALDGSGPPLRILAPTSSRTTFLQYSMRDSVRALKTLGCECMVLKEQRSFEILGPVTYHRAILNFKPDVMLVFDHLRNAFSDLLPTNLPLLTWDQDQLPRVFTKENVDQIAPHDFVAGYSKRRCMELGADQSQLLACAVPTCPDQFSGLPLTDAERERYTCDMSYVSHASQTPEAFHAEERARYDDSGTVRLLDRLFEMLPPLIEPNRGPHYPLLESVLLEATQACGIRHLADDMRTRLVRWYLWRLGDRVFRHEALSWAAQWAETSGRSLRIYGNGWHKHPTLASFAAGPADNGRELLCIYRASRINLQLMPAGFIHQRALDGLAAGGFFITREARSDLRGRDIRRLVDRMRELGITTTESFHDADDDLLNTLLAKIYDEHERHVRRNWPDLCNLLYLIGESVFPDEVFEDVNRIMFHSAASLRERADAFLDRDDLRTATVAGMRHKVNELFSYESTMRRLLEAMSAHLNRAARGAARSRTHAMSSLAPRGS